MRLRAAPAILATCLAACFGGTEPRPPLDVGITATPATATVGQTVTFVVNAQGNELQEVLINYGDASTESVVTGGATTARVTFTHEYTATGTYSVIGRAIDGVEGQKDATVQVIVQ